MFSRTTKFDGTEVGTTRKRDLTGNKYKRTPLFLETQKVGRRQVFHELSTGPVCVSQGISK